MPSSSSDFVEEKKAAAAKSGAVKWDSISFCATMLKVRHQEWAIEAEW